MSEGLAVAYCFDRNYLAYAAVSTFSLISSSASRLRVYWCVTPDMHDETNEVLLRSDLAKIGDVRIVLIETGSFENWTTGFHITPATYHRLLLPDLLPETRVLYLDADTLVLSDVAALFNTALGSNVLAGAADPLAGAGSKLARPPGDVYVNAGVLLLDLERLRHERFLDKCRAIYAAHEREIAWNDQCIINKYAEGRKLIIERRWNRRIFANKLNLGLLNGLLAGDECAIVHFVGEVKPWHGWCHPKVSELWFQWARKVPRLNIVPQRIRSSKQAMSLATALDQTEMFEEASAVKSQIIKVLMKKQAAQDAHRG